MNNFDNMFDSQCLHKSRLGILLHNYYLKDMKNSKEDKTEHIIR